ncbi:MAG: hypothetical protein HY904_01120 [Deltaproteobacteria bacterium]|nr:hypothetical protein [Deltaproteobacteria bacterium]
MALASALGCGIRNTGEACLSTGPAGDFLCAPGRCLCPKGRECKENDPADLNRTQPNTSGGDDIPVRMPDDPIVGPVCAECWNDLDCLATDPWDRPKCMPPVPVNEGGDGLPYCKHISDHPACNDQVAFTCLPGKCHPDLGVCVECTEDKDCPSDKPKCDATVEPDKIPFCREDN